jgi:hypothetical protein
MQVAEQSIPDRGGDAHVVASSQLDWVGERMAGMVGRASAVQTAGNGGSELLIFVP